MGRSSMVGEYSTTIKERLKKIRIYFLLIVCLHAVDIHVTRKEVERLTGTDITYTHTRAHKVDLGANGSTVPEARGRTVRATSHDTLTGRLESNLFCDGARLHADRRTRPNASRR